MTRWTNRTPRIAPVTRRASRPVCTAGHGEALAGVASAVADLGTKIEEYNTHLGHVHATFIGDELESRMERRELSTRVKNLGTGVNGIAEGLKKGDTASAAKLANLVEVVADLVVKVDGLACRDEAP